MISDWTRLANEVVGGPRGGDRVVDLMAAHGVTVMFGLPADSINILFDAVRRNPRVRAVTCRHEGGAALMAAAYGKLTGRPAAVTATNGPGVTHLPAGSRDAWIDGAPMVLLPGAVPHRVLGVRSFQDVDGQRLLAPWTDGSWRGESPAGLERLDVLLARTRQTRRPVAFCLAPDALTKPLRPPAPAEDRVIPASSWLSTKASIAEAIHRLEDARSVAVLLGDARNSPHEVAVAARAVAYLAPSGIQATSWGRVDPGRRLATGSDSWVTLRQADTLVVVGDWPEEVMRHLTPKHVIHVTDSPSWRVDDTAYVSLCGAAGVTVWETVEHRITSAASTPAAPSWGTAAMRQLDQVIPSDATVCIEPGPVMDAALLALSEANRQFTGSFAAATPGYGIPAALAGSIARPGSLSVAIVDARGWIEGHAEVLSARKHGLDIAVVLVTCGASQTTQLRAEAAAIGLRVLDGQENVSTPLSAFDALVIDAGERRYSASPPNLSSNETDSAADTVTVSSSTGSENPGSYRFVEGQGMSAVASAKVTGRPFCLDVADETALLRCLNPLYDAALDQTGLVLVTREQSWAHPADRLLPGLTIATLTGNHRQMPTMIKRASAMACHARGVAHVRVITDDASTPPRWAEHRSAHVTHLPGPAPGDLDTAATLLNTAASPVILVGGGASAARDAVGRLAERLGAPVVATMGGAMYDALPAFGGYVGSSGHTAANRALRTADVVLSLGVSNRGAAFELFGPKSSVVDINVDVETLTSRRGSTLSIQSSAHLFLDGLLERIESVGRTPHSLPSDHAQSWESAAQRPTLFGSLRASYVVRELDRAANRYGESVGFTSDVGINTLWLFRFRRRHAHTLWTRNFATMGFALPAAVSRARLTEEPTIAVTGDGGMAMAMAGLDPRPADDVPVLCVVLDNAGLAAIRYEQEIYGWPEYESGFVNPDFAAVAQAHGWHGVTARTAQDLADSIQEFFDSPRPTVLNVICAKDEPPMPALVPDPARVASAIFSWGRQGRRGLRSASTAMRGLMSR